MQRKVISISEDTEAGDNQVNQILKEIITLNNLLEILDLVHKEFEN